MELHGIFRSIIVPVAFLAAILLIEQAMTEPIDVNSKSGMRDCNRNQSLVTANYNKTQWKIYRMARAKYFFCQWWVRAIRHHKDEEKFELAMEKLDDQIDNFFDALTDKQLNLELETSSEERLDEMYDAAYELTEEIQDKMYDFPPK